MQYDGNLYLAQFKKSDFVYKLISFCKLFIYILSWNVRCQSIVSKLYRLKFQTSLYLYLIFTCVYGYSAQSSVTLAKFYSVFKVIFVFKGPAQLDLKEIGQVFFNDFKNKCMRKTNYIFLN